MGLDSFGAHFKDPNKTIHSTGLSTDSGSQLYLPPPSLSRSTFWGDYEYSRLSNGVSVHIARVDRSGGVRVSVALDVGSRDDPANKPGLAHFTEHLNFHGTQRLPSWRQVANHLASLGAEVNAVTTPDFSQYYLAGLPAYTEKFLSTLADQVLCSSYTNEEVSRCASIIAREFTRRFNDPLRRFYEFQVPEYLFDGCGLDHPPLGFSHAISNFTREDVLEFRARHYRPERMHVFVVGNVPDQVEKMIERHFGGIRSETNDDYVRPPFHTVWDNPRAPHGLVETIGDPGWDPVHARLYFPGVALGDYQESAYTIARHVLANAPTSLLFVRLREELSLVYDVQCSSAVYSDGSICSVLLDDVDSAEELRTSIRETLKILTSIAHDGISDDEVEIAKRQYITSVLLNMQDSQRICEVLVDQAMLRRQILLPEEAYARIERVNAQDVQAIMQQFLSPEQARICAIGGLTDFDIARARAAA